MLLKKAPATNTDALPASSASEPLSQSETLLPLARPIWKAALDVLGASVGMLMLSPVFLVAAAIVRFGSRGPVFFRHQRYGQLGNPFQVWKFRTMSATTDPAVHREYVLGLARNNGDLSKIDNEQTLIPFGGAMRSLGIDELPQFLNVLMGQMSLVGPRPDVVPPSEYQSHQLTRFRVHPGITGLWQVAGKNLTTFDEMADLDTEYVSRRSLLLDLKILFGTALYVLKQAICPDSSTG